MADDISSSSSGPRRQQFTNALEKYAILISLSCNSYYCNSFVNYPFRYGILSWFLVYVVVQLIIGIPMFFLEYFIGQFSSGSMISMYSEVAPALKGTGITNVFLQLLYLSFGLADVGKYLVVLGYTFTMPWTHCGNDYNTAECRHPYSNSSSFSNRTSFDDFEPQDSSAQFVREVLENGMGGGFLWRNALGGVIVLILIFLVAVNGTRIMGKVALGTMSFRVVTTVVLLIVGLATGLHSWGGLHGLKLYFYPSASLLHPSNWYEPVNFILSYQLMGVGILTTIGSYDKLRNNCLKDALLVAVFNFIYPFIYGIFIMVMVGYLSEVMGSDPNDIFHTDLALAEIPLALSIIPGHFLWVFLFVLMIISGHFGVLVITFEAIITSVMDAYPKFFTNRKIVALGMCVPFTLGSMIYFIGNGIGKKISTFIALYVLNLSTWGNYSWILFTFVYLYGAGRLVRDIRHVLPRISWAVTWPCYLSWIVIIPISYAIVNALVYDGIRRHISYIGDYPNWSIKVGEFVISSVLWFTTIYAIVYLIKAKGTFVQRLVSGFRPSVNWGPKESEANLAWQAYSKKRPLCCGCTHPDCCNPPISGEGDDAAIPIRIEMNSEPGQPTPHPNAAYPRQPTIEKPEVNKPEDSRTVSSIEEGLYPDLPTNP